jgi:hypothetical protein
MDISTTNITKELGVICYLIDCTLATVAAMAQTKTRKQKEYRRQIEIAQDGIDFIKTILGGGRGQTTISLLHREEHTSRMLNIIESYNGDVSLWAASYES